MIHNFLEQYSDVGELLFRVGFFITIIFSVYTKVTSPEMIASVFRNARGIGFLGTIEGVYIVAVFLALFSLMILFGLYTKIAGIALTLFFLGTILSTLATPIFSNAGVWKDFALLGASIYFMTHKTGKYSIQKYT